MSCSDCKQTKPNPAFWDMTIMRTQNGVLVHAGASPQRMEPGEQYVFTTVEDFAAWLTEKFDMPPMYTVEPGSIIPVSKKDLP